ncbi:MAG: LytR/AlgR family response regulator transcription factor [Gemmatimonadales bacterium]
MTIRAVIVDDEPLARQGLRELLEPEPDIRVVAECGDGEDAVRAVERERPDLLLLDIQMPGLDGFGVLARLAPPRPVVVFVTAHDAFALQAFEAHAIDYLLKPVEPDRFRRALERARAQLGHEQRALVAARLDELLATLPKRPRYPSRLTVRDGPRVSFVPVDEIDWIEAAGNYARLHVGAARHLLRETMSGLEETLDPERFVRIHRSTIVNVARIREIQPWFKGDHLVVLEDGTKLSLTRKYRSRLI